LLSSMAVFQNSLPALQIYLRNVL